MRRALVIGLIALTSCGDDSTANMLDAPSADASVDAPRVDAPPDAALDAAIDATAPDASSLAPACSPPSSTTICVTGTVQRFVTPQTLASDQSGLIVKAYDPIAFVTNPTTPPLGTTSIYADGSFTVDNLPRPASGLITIVTDDPSGGANLYMPTAVTAIVRVNQNIEGIVAYYVEMTTVSAWQTQIGSSNPPGCTNGLLGCGIWFGRFVDVAGYAVANLRPSRPGDDPPTTNVFCFGQNRMDLPASQKVTTNVGICGISPDYIENHTGVCASGGCSCGGSPCTPVFASATGGTAPGVIVIQTFIATQ